MSPLEINILLHYHCSSVDYRDGDFSAPAVRDSIDAFKGDLGLLEPDNSEWQRTYKLTPKAAAWIEAICNLPLPVCTWTIPINPR